MEARVLGKDYVVLKGRGGRDITNGATCNGDKFMHLAQLGKGTSCGKPIKDFLLTYADVEIDCPKCIRKLVELGYKE